jgi:hypothetical protein
VLEAVLVPRVEAKVVIPRKSGTNYRLLSLKNNRVDDLLPILAVGGEDGGDLAMLVMWEGDEIDTEETAIPHWILLKEASG